jgi:hypothetical protein
MFGIKNCSVILMLKIIVPFYAWLLFENDSVLNKFCQVGRELEISGNMH